ncbi:hypothetical protein LTR09_011469 [Extremus antarcticus]|uniref:SUN domain-containing protein n=1 Tax=Extremus antarcticus TaxID=702011 RepID=A0AAJ0D626_9PEZI|nr:hypothetical protein LTR09_011469 [Extremus antarcticus]
MRGNLRLALKLAIASGVLCHAQQSDGGAANTSATTVSSDAVQTPTTSVPIILSSASTLGNGTCASRTANYITHTLPQQCLRTGRQSTTTAKDGGSQSNATASLLTGTNSHLSDLETQLLATSTSTVIETISTSSEKLPDSTDAVGTLTKLLDPAVSETEDESALDNAKFLSFEEWKKQNSVKSPEPGRDPREGIERPRPGINNALDGFGEDGEIELDFTGFGSPASGPRQQQAAYRATDDAAAKQATPSAHSPRSKDAGKTCQERTNYASFDCAATMLKNNAECKSASSVLVENKDSYMLNTCSAQNKFFIVELCNDILVDTIVLANYEFFSSIFRHFRVSISDVYPVKLDKWKDLGTFEARNTREVQAFLIEHPQIWARYLRIEFLTHYGSEYYCPVSLLRVHGTTMLEDMRHQEDVAHSEVIDEAALEPEATATLADAQEPIASTDETSKKTVQAMPNIEIELSQAAEVAIENVTNTPAPTEHTESSDVTTPATPSTRSSANGTVALLELPTSGVSPLICPTPTVGKEEPSVSSESSLLKESAAVATNGTELSQPKEAVTASAGSSSNETEVSSVSATGSYTRNDTTVRHTSVSEPSTSKPGVVDDVSSSGVASNNSATAYDTASATSSANSMSRAASSTASAPAQPQPSTQESFFKSIHKRLQQLEANSTLSLQYIEEQSRILRDAFSKVEKRQISATTSFLTNLNQTVMQELHGFRQAYDQLWQSTVIELEGQREQYQREMLAMSSRLTLVADELVWQKRMGIVQSTLLLLCLGLVLFSRSGTTGYLEVPLMQQMMNKSTAALGRTGWESPPVSPSPESRSPVSHFRRRLWRSVTEPSAGDNAEDDTVSVVTDSRPGTKDGPLMNGVPIDVSVQPPTPPRDASVEDSREWEDADDEEDVLDIRGSQSGPSTPRGTRESESAGEGILDAG